MNKLGFLRRQSLRILLSLLIALPILLHVTGVLDLSFVQRLENYAYDLRLQWTMPNTFDKRIVIIDIDEKSLQEQGHWPWPRNKLAHLVDLLFDRYQIAVLGFDIVFAERDESSGLKGLEALARGELGGDARFNAALGKLKPQLDYDQLFAASLKDRPVALGYYFRHDGQPDSGSGMLPNPVLAQGRFNVGSIGAEVASGYAANLPELQLNSAAGGYFNTSPLLEPDGVLRRIPMLQIYKGQLYENLSLAVARLALNGPVVELEYAEGDNSRPELLESIKLSNRRIPVDANVATLIPYHGRQGSFAYLSATDILQGRVAPEVLKGAIGLVGTTAPGLKDLRTAPMQDTYAGVEFHANLIAGILDGDIKESPAYTGGFEFALGVVFALLLALALPALKPIWATALSAAAMACVLVLNLGLWKHENLAIPFASTLLLIGLLFVFNMSYGFFVESRGKRSITRLFGQYVPPELVDEMAKDPDAFNLLGESREMTVLFSDVRGFTTISEGLDPRQLTQLMNEFLTPMTKVIQKHRGTIDKYMGDAIMAFWGAPLPDDQHARRALLAALEMIASLEALQNHFKSRGWPPIKVGVGLNTGEMTVGNMGSEFRLAYTVMGDAVNLGSRLEGLTKEYGVQIIVSEYTRLAVPDFVYRELDRVRVKGKDKPVSIYEPICQTEECAAAVLEELSQYHAGLAAYRAQNWPLAEQVFKDLQAHDPDRLVYQIYAGRITHFQEFPPGATWDGAFTFTSK